MPTIASHGRRGYKQGCRCDQCKCAEREYQQDLRRRKQEEPAGFAGRGLTLLAGSGNKRLTSVNSSTNAANSSEYGPVEAAVRAEVEPLASSNPGLAAAVIALSQVLDDSRATSTKPAAAAKMADLLATLHKGADRKQSKLTAIRSMTSGNGKTG